MATYKRNEIKTEVLPHINRNAYLYKRNKNAYEYSLHVENERKRKASEIKDNLTMILTVALVLAIILFGREPFAQFILWLGGMM